MMSIIKGRNKFICNSLLSECKNEQKSVLTNVNMQRNALPYFQMFAFSFFDGSHIYRFYVFPPSIGVTLVTLRHRYLH